MQKREKFGARSKERTQAEAIFYQRLKDGVVPDCAGREREFVDYEARDRPSSSRAMKMCADCPLFIECREVTEERRPDWGVWAGRVFGAQGVLGKLDLTGTEEYVNNRDKKLAS